MTEVRLGVFSKVWRILAAAIGLLAFAPDVFAQAAQQILSVAFVRVSLAEVPLSPWLTAGIAIVLAVMAAAMLRRGGRRGGRLLGWVLVLAAGGVLLAASGQRLISEAIAGADPPVIDLTVSPGTLNVIVYSDETLVVDVNNATIHTERITAINLTIGPYFFAPNPGTCFVGLLLSPGQSCTVNLILD